MVIDETFPNGTSDFTSYINNATAMNAGVFFAPCSIAYITQIIDQSAAQGASFALLGSDTWDNNKVIEVATGTNLPIYVSTFYQEGGDPEFDAGIKEWINANDEAKTNNGGNDMVAAVTVMGYDAYMVALEALKNAGTTDSKAVNEALWTTTYDGVSGAIAFLPETGDAARDTAYIKVANTVDGVWDFAAVQGVE